MNTVVWVVHSISDGCGERVDHSILALDVHVGSDVAQNSVGHVGGSNVEIDI